MRPRDRLGFPYAATNSLLPAMPLSKSKPFPNPNPAQILVLSATEAQEYMTGLPTEGQAGQKESPQSNSSKLLLSKVTLAVQVQPALQTAYRTRGS